MGHRQRRAPRALEVTTNVTKVSTAQAAAASLKTNPVIDFLYQAGVTLLELSAVVAYFVGMEFHPQSDSLSFSHFVQWRSVIIVQGIIGVMCVLRFVSQITVQQQWLRMLFSGSAFLEFTTSVPAIILMIATKGDANEGELTFWTPFFLRVWKAQHHCGLTIQRFSGLHPALQEIALQILFLTALLLSGIACTQIVQMIDINDRVYFHDVTYFVIVTVGTIGYGDIEPLSREGMVVAIVLIFVAMFFLPVLLNNVTEMVAFLRAQNRYSKRFPHVVICGTFSLSEVTLQLHEFFFGERQFSMLNLVIVSPEPFDNEIANLVAHPMYKGRVTLCVGDTTNRNQLERFKVRDADCVFFFSPRSEVGHCGDLATLIGSVTFGRYSRQLPQYMMLRRGKYATAMNFASTVVMQREKLKFTAMGMALKYPGFLPCFLNLIKTSALYVPEDKEWFSDYQRGMANSLLQIAVADDFEGRPFSYVVAALMTQRGVPCIGVVRYEDSRFLLAPMKHILRSSDILIVIGHNSQEVYQKTKKKKEKEFTAPTENKHRYREMKELVESSGFGAPHPSTFLTKKRRQADSYPFRNHIVLIDLSSTLERSDCSYEENVDARVNQSNDLLQLLDPFLEETSLTIVCLSRSEPSEELCDAWPLQMQPLYWICGCGTEPKDLDKCGIASARAVVIFTATEGISTTGDAAVVLVQRMVMGKLVAAGRATEVQVLVEVDDPQSLGSCYPDFALGTEESIVADSMNDYFMTPAFITGRGISSSMVDHLLFQAYFNTYVPQVVESIFHRPQPRVSRTAAAKQKRRGEPFEQEEIPKRNSPLHTAPVAEFFKGVNQRAMNQTRYDALSRAVLLQGFVPIGLYRKIVEGPASLGLAGHRYFYTAPNPETLLDDEDIVYYLGHL